MEPRQGGQAAVTLLPGTRLQRGQPVLSFQVAQLAIAHAVLACAGATYVLQLAWTRARRGPGHIDKQTAGQEPVRGAALARLSGPSHACTSQTQGGPSLPSSACSCAEPQVASPAGTGGGCAAWPPGHGTLSLTYTHTTTTCARCTMSAATRLARATSSALSASTMSSMWKLQAGGNTWDA